MLEVQESILRMEYQFSAVDGSEFSAPNRGHGLRSRIGSEWLEVTSRTAGACVVPCTAACARGGLGAGCWPVASSRGGLPTLAAACKGRPARRPVALVSVVLPHNGF